MIVVDYRVGSEDLAEPLEAMGLEVARDANGKLLKLDFADIAFTAKGPQGRPRSVGIELKKLGDLVSSLRTGRLSGHQLPGLCESYDYTWLLVEGYWRTNSQGQVVIERWSRTTRRMEWVPAPGGMTSAEMQKQVFTLELCGGLRPHWANTRNDTLQFIANLYRWFNDKHMDKHQSHLTTHTPMSFIKVSAFRDAIQRYPGIGTKASLAVEQYFRGSLRRATAASVDEWAGIEVVGDKGPRRLGLSVAKQIVAFCNGHE